MVQLSHLWAPAHGIAADSTWCKMFSNWWPSSVQVSEEWLFGLRREQSLHWSVKSFWGAYYYRAVLEFILKQNTLQQPWKPLIMLAYFWSNAVNVWVHVWTISRQVDETSCRLMSYRKSKAEYYSRSQYKTTFFAVHRFQEKLYLF